MSATKSALRTIALCLATTAGIVAADRNDKWWFDNLAGPDSSAFANLDQISRSNVERLGVAWTYPYAQTGFNPIVVGNVLFTAARENALVALDASTGKEIWIHEGLGGMTSRGVNYWQSESGRDRRLLFLIDNFLQAIDAKTGQSISDFGRNGVVDLREGLLRGEYIGWSSGSPGKIWRNLIILGSATGEAFVSPPGDIRAYDVVTGKLVWQFHTIPQPGEFGYETWPKDAWKYVGGANNWGSMSVDNERGIVYVPTGSATYDFYGADRHGANLFANCLLALDARTGKRLWHFQTVHHDLWDLDNVSAPQLVTVRRNGRRIDAVAQAGKTGFLYVFNRVTGEPLWPIEERPVPASEAPYERAYPTQPFPTKPEPFAKQSFTAGDVNPWLLKPDDYQATRKRIENAINGSGPFGGLFNPPAVDREAVSMPGNQGGSNWGTTAANPGKGMVFVVGVNQVALLELENIATRSDGADAPSSFAGAAVFREHCQQCHGANLEGGGAGVPALVRVGDRMSADAIRAVVSGGRGLMRPINGLTSNQMTSVIAFLAAGGDPLGDFRGRGMKNLPPGPVVARGGASRPAARVPGPGNTYPGAGGNAGNYKYPAGADVPPARYTSDYGVLSSATMPPYTTISAYDLNSGEIKWQVANGDHAPTIAAGGPSDTGGLGARNGMVVTRGGLVFQAGGDGKFRAFDDETGRVLWTGNFHGTSSGVPASYEARGRQYVVMIAGGGETAAGDAPAGMIAFALQAN